MIFIFLNKIWLFENPNKQLMKFEKVSLQVNSLKKICLYLLSYLKKKTIKLM